MIRVWDDDRAGEAPTGLTERHRRRRVMRSSVHTATVWQGAELVSMEHQLGEGW